METLDNDVNLIDPKSVSPRSAGMKWGIIGAAIYIVIELVSYLAGIGPEAVVANGLKGLLTFLVGIFSVSMAIKEHRAQLGGYIRGARCVTVGLWSGLFYGLITAVWAVIFLTFIAPDFMNDTIATMVNTYEEQGMSDEQIDMITGIMSMVQGPIPMALSSVIGGLINGVILSIVPALIMKKKAPGMF